MYYIIPLKPHDVVPKHFFFVCVCFYVSVPLLFLGSQRSEWES